MVRLYLEKMDRGTMREREGERERESASKSGHCAWAAFVWQYLDGI